MIGEQPTDKFETEKLDELEEEEHQRVKEEEIIVQDEDKPKTIDEDADQQKQKSPKKKKILRRKSKSEIKPETEDEKSTIVSTDIDDLIDINLEKSPPSLDNEEIISKQGKKSFSSTDATCCFSMFCILGLFFLPGRFALID